MHKQGHSGKHAGARAGQAPVKIWSPPQGYPKYLDEKGTLIVDYVTGYADKIAQQFGQDKLSNNQLQAFYRFIKGQQQALRYGREFNEVLVELKKLKAIAHDRAHRRNSGVTASFKEFIDKNIDALTVSGGQKMFEKGFVEHFQAVVAYCAGRLKEGGR